MGKITDELNKGKGKHGEIHTPEPKRQRAHNKGQTKACKTTDENDEWQRQRAAQYGRSINPYPEKCSSRQGNLTGRS